MLTEEQMIEALPEPQRTTIRAIYARKPEELHPCPQKNTWYYYAPEGCLCANGRPYYSSLKVGTENKLIMLFCGGGCAPDAYSAARPNTIPAVEGEQQFYMQDTLVAGYFLGHGGIGSKDRAENPFRDWSVVVITYASGDFHCGTNDFAFDDPEKGKGVCRHRGYFNYRAMVEKMKEFVPAPEKLLVTGFSGGAFGAAILTDDVMGLFPDCKDVTCLPDSGVLSCPHWKETAMAQWKAPAEIAERIVSDDLSLDCLLALRKKHGERVKIAVGCTYRDALLSQMQNYLDGRTFIFDGVGGDAFQALLTRHVRALREHIPDVALYIFDRPSEVGNGLTDHTFETADYVFDYVFDGVKLIDWIWDAVNGRPQQVGLSLLGLDK